jgi:hypothetical protein
VRFRRQQLLRLGAEAAELFILRLVLLHPLDGLLVAPAGFAPVAEPPVGHGQEKPVVTVAGEKAWPCGEARPGQERDKGGVEK